MIVKNNIQILNLLILIMCRPTHYQFQLIYLNIKIYNNYAP